MRKFLGTCLILVGLTGFGIVPTAQAQEEDSAQVARQVEDLNRQAAAEFRAGNFEEAIDLFEDAYALQPVPNLLYNIGRCYEQLEEWDEAIRYFERFITAPDVETQAREHAMEKVQSLREIKAAIARGEEPEPRDDDPIGPVDGPNRTPAFAAIGGGLALVGGGVVMGLMASGNASQISDTDLSYDDRLAARNSARTQGIVADVLYVSGAAVTLVGIYLFVTAGSADDAPAPTAGIFQPWITRDSAGLGFYIGF